MNVEEAPSRRGERETHAGSESRESLGADVTGILDSVDVPIIVVSPECILTRFNRAASDILSLTPTDIGRPASALAGLAGSQDLEKLCTQAIADVTPIRRDVRIGERHFVLRVAPCATSGGQCSGAVLTFANVTAFRASLEQAVYEREYTKAVLNTVGSPLVVLNAELRIHSANRAFYVLFGVSRDDTQNVSLQTLGDDDDDWTRSDLWRSLRAVLSGTSEFELQEIVVTVPSLGKRTLLLDARRISRDVAGAILVSFQDITEQKRAAAAIQQSEYRFRQMVDALPVAVYTTDAEGHLTHFNPAAVEFAGRVPTVGEDHWCVTYKLYRPDGAPLPRDKSPMAIALKERRPLRGEEAIAERPDGERRWFQPFPTPLFDDAGRLIGGINMLLDITTRKQAAEVLQDANRRKDEFLALLAHELRNPLAPIRAGIEFIRVSGDSPESVRQVRSIMERQVSHMVRLVDDLLDVSRIASGKIVLQRAPSSVTELIRTAIEAQQAAIDAAKIDVTCELSESPSAIDVDPVRFIQILSNVLHNASKFTAAHGKIRVSAKIVASDTNPQVAIAVSDTGIGISKEMLPRVFELFAQAEAPTERAHGGLGIGLALARRLVEMHGGEIAAHSDGPGQGSTFVIKMPLCELVVKEAPSRVDTPCIASRVVIIDDNEDAADTLSMLVKRLGGSSRTAYDATSGLQAVSDFQPDTVLLDIGMPGIDGYETCRQLRQKTSPGNLTIIAVSGWGQAHDKQRALDAGFDLHLTKPVDAKALAHVLVRKVPRQSP
jgi:signal transduction histidine kinase/ActR/RegA family two-component response regulator